MRWSSCCFIVFFFLFFQVNPKNTQKASTSSQLKECPMPFCCVWSLFSGQSKKGFFSLFLSFLFLNVKLFFLSKLTTKKLKSQKIYPKKMALVFVSLIIEHKYLLPLFKNTGKLTQTRNGQIVSLSSMW